MDKQHLAAVSCALIYQLFTDSPWKEARNDRVDDRFCYSCSAAAC